MLLWAVVAGERCWLEDGSGGGTIMREKTSRENAPEASYDASGARTGPAVAAIDGGLQQIEPGANATNLSSPKCRLHVCHKPPTAAIVHSNDGRYYHLACTRTLCGRPWCIPSTPFTSNALVSAMPPSFLGLQPCLTLRLEPQHTAPLVFARHPDSVPGTYPDVGGRMGWMKQAQFCMGTQVRRRRCLCRLLSTLGLCRPVPRIPSPPGAL